VIPNNFFVGGGPSDSLISAVGAAMLIVAIILMLVLPRKYVVVPILLAVFLIPQGEGVVIGGAHFMPARVIALFGLLKLAWVCHSSHEQVFAGGMNSLDSAFLWNAIAHTAAFILLWMQIAAVTNQLGGLLGGLGMYIVLRFFIREDQDIYRVVKVLAIIAVLNAVGMIYEHVRVQNLFGLLIGGVDPVPLIREGKIRSQGAFGHAILAGTFGATLLPMFIALWMDGKAKIIASAGVISAMIMVLTSASSTPLMAIFGVGVGILFWPLRRNMRIVRWVVALTLLALHLAMKAPVWFLIAHVDMVGGSASFDRAYLIDVFIRHFWDWWLVGTRDIGSWGWSMWDLSDMYVSQGESGGLVTFIFFIAIITRSFSRIGKARKAVAGRRREWFMWLLGSALFANVMAFFGVSYWDQTYVAWYALLAIISVATEPILARKTVPKKLEAIAEREPAMASISQTIDFLTPQISERG
jgi:hypothetical protein